jgi:hypothetical protein
MSSENGEVMAVYAGPEGEIPNGPAEVYFLESILALPSTSFKSRWLRMYLVDAS